MSALPQIVVASRNPKKAEELLALLVPPWEAKGPLSQLEVKTLADFPEASEVEEDADTFAGNARKKAIENARAIGRWVLADDSGLSVDILKGAPGVHSARYAGAHGDDHANNTRLLAELTHVDDEDRGAAFVCALALADPNGAIHAEVEGRCRGRITRAPRGTNGFGYDPLFLIREYHKTFGELAPVVKQQISHRARAVTMLRPVLERLIARGELA